jgi:hypothetical protein
MLCHSLDGDEGRQQDSRRREEEQRPRGSPAVRAGALDRVDEEDQPGNERRRPWDVEPAQAPRTGVSRQQVAGGAQGDDPHGEVDEEDGFPTHPARQDAAEQHSGGGAATADRTPNAERPRPLRSGVGRGDDREGRRRQHCGAEALRGTGSDQHSRRGRQAAAQGGDGEDREPHEEHVAPPEEIGRAAPEQHQPPGEENVRGHHPLQVTRSEAEVLTDRRQGDVHDGDVEDHHELRDRKQDEDGPGAAALAVAAGRLISVAVHWYLRSQG